MPWGPVSYGLFLILKIGCFAANRKPGCTGGS